MKLLLDTHTVLWFWWDDPRLSAKARDVISDPANQKFVSIVTPWEVAIKVSLKKLDIGGSYPGFFKMHMFRANFDWLEVTDDHFNGLLAMPFHHRDPFDRMLISQSRMEKMPLVSGDTNFDAYGVNRIWD
jgi:PIN domain nuclease of toxin-antitoxin system